MTTLTAASRELMRRPKDERFDSVQALHDAALGYRNRANTATVKTSRLKAVNHDGRVELDSPHMRVKLNNWSFGQLATAANAPGSYLATLPADLAVECINHGIATATSADSDRPNKLLLDGASTGMATLRALTSTKYARIWNMDVTARLLRLQEEQGWNPAPAAFDGSRGLYMGDRDMFAFMVDNDRRIFESLPGGGLSRGFYLRNSEVGSASFHIASFNYAFICGNHMIWGARNLREVKIRHIGKAGDIAFDGLEAELIKYANSSAKEEELQIEAMRRYTIGKDLDEVLDVIMGLKIDGMSRGLAKQAYEKTIEHEDWYGAPNTVWGFSNGITEIARDLPNADARVRMEAVASKVMEIAL